jgi:aspartate ammonia-lyase
LAILQSLFQEKEQAFAHVVKIGRTEWQEAVPMTLGLEFGGFAEAFARDRWRTFKCEERLRVVNLGGTAVGTGLTAPRDYIFGVVDKLRQLTGLGLSRGEHLVDQTANVDAFVEVSGILKAVATNLIKVGRDLRHLHSLGEIQLEAVQAGSSIMPGKVNPVLCEAVIQAGIRAKGEDMVLAEAAGMGSLQINEFMPLIADALLTNLRLLCNGVDTLSRCVKGLKADRDVCETNFIHSPTLMTALLPYLGYDKTQQLIVEFSKVDNQPLLEFLEARLGKDILRLFSAENLTKLGYE